MVRDIRWSSCGGGWLRLWGRAKSKDALFDCSCAALHSTALIDLNHDLVPTQKPWSAGVIIE